MWIELWITPFLKNEDLKTSIFFTPSFCLLGPFFGLPVQIQTAPLDKEGGAQFLFGDAQEELLLFRQGLKELIIVRGLRTGLWFAVDRVHVLDALAILSFNFSWRLV